MLWMVWGQPQAKTAGKTTPVLLQKSATLVGAGRHSGVRLAAWTCVLPHTCLVLSFHVSHHLFNTHGHIRIQTEDSACELNWATGWWLLVI